MKRIVKERDRLLRRAARIVGVFGAAASVAAIAPPGAVSPGTLAWGIVLMCALTVALVGLAANGSAMWAVVATGSAIGFILVIGLSSPRLNPASGSAVAVAAGLAAASVALTLAARRETRGLLIVLAVATIAVTFIVSLRGGTMPVTVAVAGSGWIACALVAIFVAQGVVRAAERVDEIGRAHRAERLASEVEAQHRQDARLLHDTVLATLSLLAHSGVGVSPDALREQAAEDARLLRQLRLGNAPLPPPERILYQPEEDPDALLGATLESVKQRFGRMGLDVHWHGSGQLFLHREALDAFLGALGECLENVRRHAGVTEADVTITDDETTVRALVTDAGVGFDLHAVDGHRLGFAESVVGRLRAAGGRARLFSSPGSGTTVVLEVPK
jgi:signal transduction histidine kinase